MSTDQEIQAQNAAIWKAKGIVTYREAAAQRKQQNIQQFGNEYGWDAAVRGAAYDNGAAAAAGKGVLQSGSWFATQEAADAYGKGIAPPKQPILTAPPRAPAPPPRAPAPPPQPILTAPPRAPAPPPVPGNIAQPKQPILTAPPPVDRHPDTPSWYNPVQSATPAQAPAPMQRQAPVRDAFRPAPPPHPTLLRNTSGQTGSISMKAGGPTKGIINAGKVAY